MFFERRIKNILKIFFKTTTKNSGLRGHVWLLIAWLDPPTSLFGGGGQWQYVKTPLLSWLFPIFNQW
jgi:hypothetical protein